jgi:2-oxoglutarate ferredoxin oxidoreductase subunit alpha
MASKLVNKSGTKPPSSPTECFEFAARAFDIADRLQSPVIVMSDLELGMNEQICDPLNWDDKHEYDRGKVLNAAQLEEIGKFGRYLDVDGDGISYRTYPICKFSYFFYSIWRFFALLLYFFC